MSEFDEGCFSKRDTKKETVKCQCTTNERKLVDIMNNKKTKGNKKGKQRKTADSRSKNKDKSGESPILKKRTESRRARSK